MRRGSSTPVKGSPNSGGGAKGQQQQEPHEGGTPRTSGHGGNALVTGGTPAPGSPMMAGSGPPHGPAPPLLPPAPSAPLERTIFDRLADALLGVSPDEAAAAGGAATSKYALICGACFAHNGLVAKEEYDSIRASSPSRLVLADTTSLMGVNARMDRIHLPEVRLLQPSSQGLRSCSTTSSSKHDGPRRLYRRRTSTYHFVSLCDLRLRLRLRLRRCCWRTPPGSVHACSLAALGFFRVGGRH